MFLYDDDNVTQTKILDFAEDEPYPDTFDDIIARFENCAWMESFGLMLGVGAPMDVKITINAIGTPPEAGAACLGLSQVPEYLRKMKGVSLVFNEDDHRA